MKRLRLIPLLCIFLLAASSSEPELPLQVTYSFITIQGSAAVNIKPDMVLHSGDRIKVLFEANQDCYVYLLQHGASGKTSALYPSARLSKSNLVKAGVQQELPPKARWFVLDDNTGRESLVLVASLAPISGLDELLAKLNAAQDDQEKEEASKSLQDELDGLFKRRGGTEAERPIPAGGTAGFKERSIGDADKGTPLSFTKPNRGKGQAPSAIISGKDLVAKEIVFEHRP